MDSKARSTARLLCGQIPPLSVATVSETVDFGTQRSSGLTSPESSTETRVRNQSSKTSPPHRF